MIRVHGYLGTITEAMRTDVAASALAVGGRRHLDALGVPEEKRQVLGLIGPAIERIQALPADAARLRVLAEETGQQFSTAQVVGVLCAALLALVGIWLAERTLLRLAPDKLPQGRLRRSLLAVGRVLAHVVIVGIAAEITYAILKQQSSLSADWNDIGRTLLRVSMFAAFVVGLGRALLANRHESWRLMPLTNSTAASLRPLPWAAALVLSLVGLLKYLTAAAGVSLAAEVAAEGWRQQAERDRAIVTAAREYAAADAAYHEATTGWTERLRNDARLARLALLVAASPNTERTQP